MKNIGILVFLILFVLTTAQARHQVPPSEPIISENVHKLEILASWQGQNNGFVAATFSPDSSTLALALNDGVVQLLSFPSLNPENLLKGVGLEASQIKFSPDGSRLMLSDLYGNYEFWDIRTGKLLNAYAYEADEVWSEVDADLQHFVILDRENNVVLKNTITEEQVFSLNQLAVFPRPQINQDGSKLLTANPDGFSVWDVTTGTTEHQFGEPANTELSGFGFSPDGKLIWANWRDWQYGRDISKNRSIIQFWSTADGTEVLTMSGGGSHIQMYFSELNNLVATSGENDQLQSSVWVWNIQNGKLLGEAGIPTGGGVAGFNPDGSLLAVASGTATKVRFWDASSPEKLAIFSVDIGSGTFIPPVFSSDGRYLLTVGSDIRVWGVPSGE